ncbi:AMP-binding protein [Psychrobacillus sp. FSL W7-1457]|uniref:AMP-dependent synthetase/ligase n=1 Tax=Psychrobacillus sp. FSL W7-1457 TaxID=2954547 RepID=UPI00315B2153
MDHKTLPTLLAERSANHEQEVALRQKQLGIWHEVTWGEYSKKVNQLSIILSEYFDFYKGERLAIIADNRQEWVYTQLAAQSLGGVTVGIYPESLPEQIIFYLNDCKARIVLVDNQEQVDKLLGIEEQIPLVEQIIFFNKQGMRHYKHPKLVDFEDLLSDGILLLQDKAKFLVDPPEEVLENDPAIIAYSAATSGMPKGVILTHANLIDAAEGLLAIDNVKTKDDYFSFLPFAWIHEQILGIVTPLIKGVVVNFPERPHTVLGDLREIGPHTLLAPPRVYQSIMSSFTNRIEGASKFKKTIYNFFKKFGDKAARAELNKEPINFVDKAMYILGDIIVFSAIRDHLGLARVKRAYVAGAALHPEAFYFYHSIGVNLKQTYGGTEVAGIAFVQRDKDVRAGSSGKALPNTLAKIGEDGAVYIKNSAVATNYIGGESTHGGDGWISLGDCGHLEDDGHLYVLDRLEDIIIAENGQVIYPRLIENKLKSNPYILEAVCFGQNKPYVTAMINMNWNSMGRWADKQRIAYTDYGELAKNNQVIEFLEQQVSLLMKDLPSFARVEKFTLLHRPFSIEEGELTRTYKIRRNFIEDRYRVLIDGMYTERESIPMGTSEADSLRVIQLNRGQEVTL